MLRRYIIGSPFERLAFVVRDMSQQLHTFVTEREALPNLYNNILAAELAVALCRPNRTFVDVGAHIGSMISAASRDPTVTVIAFEAIPDKAAVLRRKFPRAEIHACAVGDKSGTVSFFVDPRLSGYSSLSADAGREEITVPIRTLDDVIKSDSVDVIKIDVEGAELGVLLGAGAVVARCRPTIMFESGPGQILGYSKPDIWRWFDERDYQIFLPTRLAHDGPSATLDVFLDSHEYPRHTTNYFGVPSERRGDILIAARAYIGR